MPAYEKALLPPGIRSRLIDGVNGLAMHVLEAGEPGRPALLLLHGFPELAYSCRRLLPLLAEAGYHAIAPDQRGYGRTTGWDPDYDGDVASFRMLNVVRDAFGLVSALGLPSVAAVIGHDFGAPVAAYAALIRPDVFTRLVLMSAPFAGPPELPSPSAAAGGPRSGHVSAEPGIHQALAGLDPPRKHYQLYYSTREANANMWRPPEGVHAFLRAYFHYKSADWTGNRPARLKDWSAGSLAEMPTYYIMERDKGMAESVRPMMPSASEIAQCGWLREDELAVYAAEFGRTGFQGGLNWYRCRTGPRFTAELELYAGRAIEVPGLFTLHRRARALCRPRDRGAGAVHRRQERLGGLPGAGQFRAHAGPGLRRHAGLPPGGRRRALGAAGAAGAGGEVAAVVPGELSARRS
jgi:pimeloyl-ACP methyl ester carboxylesterase